MTVTLDPVPCVGPCNRTWRERDRQQSEIHVPPRMGTPIWCDPCLWKLHTVIRQMPRHAVYLQDQIRNATTSRREHVSGTQTRPLHARETYARAIDEVTETLTSWWDAIRDARGPLAQPEEKRVPGVRQGRLIISASDYLTAMLPWLAEGPLGVDGTLMFGMEINRLHHRALRLTHRDDRRPVRCPMPCPRCDLLSLEHELDSLTRATDAIVCVNRDCSAVFTDEEYRELITAYTAKIRAWQTVMST